MTNRIVRAALALCIVSAAAFAQEKHKVAVYMSGDNQTTESKIVGGELTSALTKSKSFTATERTSAFRSAISQEKDFQQSGAVDDAQIAELGKSSGAQYVCVAELVDLSKYFTNTSEFMLIARFINVEKAVIDGSSYLIDVLPDEDAVSDVSGVLAKDLIADFERRGKDKAKEMAAIYAASSDDAVVERILQPLLTHAVSRSGKYAVTERTGSFMKTLAEEMETQYSGEVNDDELARLGGNAGAKYVIAISAAGTYFNVRTIDVKTADIITSEQKRIDFKSVKTIEKTSSDLITLFLGGEVDKSVKQAARSATATRDSIEAVARQKAEAADKAMRKTRYGLTGAVGVSFDDIGTAMFLEAGGAATFFLHKNAQFAPQVNIIVGTADEALFYGASVPILVQVSTDNKRFASIFASTGIGFDYVMDEYGSVFNAKFILGIGMSAFKMVQLDLVKVNLGTAYNSFSTGVRLMY